MNILEIQIIDSIDAYNDDEPLQSDYKITCFTGNTVVNSTLGDVNENIGDESSLLWRMKTNNVKYTIFMMMLISQTLGIFFVAYFTFNRLCQSRHDCILSMFPICLIFTIFIVTAITLKTIKAEWVSRWVYTVENNCAFLLKKRSGCLPCAVFLDQEIKSKAYGLNKKSYPITLLHFKHSNTSLIKVALFHLPSEVSFHQAVVCDVNDCLQYYHSMGLPNYNFMGILIVVYCDLEVSCSEIIPNFILFLEKSGFKILNHKLNFAIIAIKDRFSSAYDKEQWKLNSEDSNIQIHLPPTIINKHAHGLFLDQS
jgi:hypothetical protein